MLIALVYLVYCKLPNKVSKVWVYVGLLSTFWFTMVQLFCLIGRCDWSYYIILRVKRSLRADSNYFDRNSPTFFVFLPRFLVINNRKSLFLPRWYFIISTPWGGGAISRNIYPWLIEKLFWDVHEKNRKIFSLDWPNYLMFRFGNYMNNFFEIRSVLFFF